MTDGGADASGGSPVERAQAAVEAAVAELRAGGARDEALAAFVPERRVLGIRRSPRLVPDGRVWRAGALLLGSDGRLFATGRVVRAERPARRSVLAASVAEHRALQAAAVRGGHPEGESVNFDAVPVSYEELITTGASGPLFLSDGDVLVRWNASVPDAGTEIGRYLRDRVDLLVHPPQGA
ncbi:hypothetical protein ABIQ69_01725 [Agromyces sp. G08B096]|uniref:Glutaminase n=1 Tax=Agromyces sp. G08B096 TaxID=3156399 RepID=A0AAU7WAB6_9MICO